jgi:hypothetical protein
MKKLKNFTGKEQKLFSQKSFMTIKANLRCKLFKKELAPYGILV